MRRWFAARVSSEPRFITGQVREVEELFGTPLPGLPAGFLQGEDREPILVELSPRLRRTGRDLISFIYHSLSQPADTGERAISQHGRTVTPLDDFERELEAVLGTIIEQERRQGLMNLFWLAHAQHLADLLHECFSRPDVQPDIKYQMHPFLQGVHRNTLERVWVRYRHRPGNLLQRNLGAEFNPALIDCIIDDQLPLTERRVADLDFMTLLVEANKRFRLVFRDYRELQTVFRERLGQLLFRRDPRLLEVIRRSAPGLKIEADDERTRTRLLFNRHIITHLVADLASRAGGGVHSPVDRLELISQRGWSDLVLDYVDVVQAVKRSEALDLLRQAIGGVSLQRTETEVRSLFEAGRLYRFVPQAEICTQVRKVTLLFADVRGFTAISEGAVSERELAERLYEVFDPLAALVQEHHGVIDKFTGDGVMVTFGGSRESREDELNALRTAVAIQAMMAELRAAARTTFTIGISIHTGRAQTVDFVVDDRSTDRTLIGRNVNIAGRLSGSGERLGEEAPPAHTISGGPPRPADGDVWVDETGTLYNRGIVVSQDTVEELVLRGTAAPWIGGASSRGYRFLDERLRRIVLLEYVGDAKFKGVARSIGIYRLGVEEPETLGATQRQGLA
jgi:class 3 adenylate cyclase